MNKRVFFILTSDGSRNRDLEKLLNSINKINNSFVLFVDQSQDYSKTEIVFSKFKFDYQLIDVGHVIPLSRARNMALDYLERNLNPSDEDVLLFSDDDCFYSDEFIDFINNEFGDDVYVFPVVDHNTSEFFTQRGVKKSKVASV